MEIKFRAWDKISKKMWYDVESHKENNFKVNQGKKKKWVITQFTGLKDKNGEEIYIGDILDWDKKCTIQIKPKEELGFYYDVLSKKDKNVVCYDIRFYRSEENATVIGNIYEDCSYNNGKVTK